MLGKNESYIECVRVDKDTVKCDGLHYHLAELLGASDSLFWVYLILYICLVLFAGTYIHTRCIQLASLVLIT